MKKKIFFSLLVALAVVFAGWKFFKKENKGEEKKYMPEKAAFGEIKEFVDTTGQIEPLNRVEILPPSSGRIEKIFIEEGSNVKSGDVLALMSSQDRVAILDSARAMGDKEYEYWKEAYKPIKIIAPISGRIILRNIVEGQTVGASTVLFAMSDSLIAVASVDESDIGKVKNRQKAEIKLDAYPDKAVKGEVFQILDEGKNSSNVIIYKVKIRPYIVPEFFKSQMTANIKIEVSSGRKALLVPSSAIVYSPEGNTYIITGFDSKKNPVKKEVKTGAEYEGKTEIMSGLEPSDPVYIEVKNYKPQARKDNNSSPFMPKRPTGQAREAIRKAR